MPRSTYAVTVTGNNGCTASAFIVITQDISIPNAEITNNTGTSVLTCSVLNISLTATGGVSYLWDNNSANENRTVNAPGTYAVTVTGNNGCTASAFIVITQDISIPNAEITNNTGTSVLTCSVLNISLTATGGVSYLWDNNSANENRTVNAPGTYAFTVTVNNGCTASAFIVITQDISIPNAEITNNTGTSVLTCSVLNISLTATGGVSYLWDDNSANENRTVNAPGTYAVTVTGNNGCTASAFIVITQDISIPNAEITNNTGTSVLTCSVLNISLTATGGVSYLWDNNSANENRTVNAPGTYAVTVTGNNGCTASAFIVITQDISIPNAEITNNTGTSVLTCSVLNISLTATGGVSYLWDNNSANENRTVNAPGTYAVTVTGNNGCTASAFIVITQDISIPNAEITNNTGTSVLTCSVLNISLTATGGVSYLWDNNSANENRTVNAPGTYAVTVTGNNGCTASAFIVITQDISIPNAEITNNTGTSVLTCSVLNISLTATGGVSYLWDNNSANENRTVNAPGTYAVTVTGNNGCTASAFIVITQDISIPNAEITNNTGTSVLTCSVLNISLTATGGVSYLWDNNSANENRTVNAPGTYAVTVTGNNGCTASAFIVITQDISIPNAEITNNPNTTELTCSVTSIDLTATGGVSYLWDNNSANENRTVNAPGTYAVTVTGNNGCTASASIDITENITPPNAGITNIPNTTVLTCSVTSISLTATGGVAYEWEDNNSTDPDRTVSDPGTYSVTVTGMNGCTASASIDITENITPPNAGITNIPNTTVLTCSVTSISLTATGGVAYEWEDNNSTDPDRTVSDPGTYSVTVTGSNGCTASASIDITENITPPNAGITNIPNTTVLTCSVTSISLTATGGVAYEWEDNNSTDPDRTVSDPGTYSVTVTGSNGCTASASIDITENITPPNAGITNIPNTTVLTCSVTSISLTATGGVSYLWDNSSTDADRTVNASGNYNVTVTSSNGCTDSASILITGEGAPLAGITNNTGTTVLSCNTLEINLTATGGVSYVWDDSSTDANRIVNTSGTYTVTVTGISGCTASVSIVITGDTSAISASITPNGPTTFCFGDYVTLDAGDFSSYQWNITAGNATTPTVIATTGGLYAVTVTNVSGCTASASIIITVEESPNGSLSGNMSGVCEEDNINITAAGGVFYEWEGPGGYSSIGAILNRNNATTAMTGTYSVAITGSNGCTAMITTFITVQTKPVVAITGDTNICSGNDINLTASGGYNYDWSGPGGYSTNGTLLFRNNATVLMSGTYSVTVTNAYGCTTSASVFVNVNASPPASITGNTGLCLGGTLNLTASGGIAYNWSGPGGYSATGSSITRTNIDGTMVGNYTVTVTDSNGCSWLTAVSVTVNSASASISGNSGFCTGSTITLTASGGTSYSWSGPGGYTASGATMMRFGATAGMAGTYTVTVTGAGGCTATANHTITVGTLFTSTISGTTSYCEGTTISLAVSGGSSYLWSGPGGFSATSSSISIPGATPSMSGTYTVTVTNAGGCTAFASKVVTVNTLPTVSISGTTNVCVGAVVSLMASGGSSYAWSGPGFSATTATINRPNANISMSGTYTVTVTSSSGCKSTASIVVTVNPKPTAAITGNSSVCTGSTLTLTASGGVSYAWSGPLGFSDVNATINREGMTASMAGTYKVTVTNAYGCTGTASKYITVLTTPTATISGTTAACAGTNIGLSASGGSTYLWNGPDGFTAATASFTRTNATVTMSGTYTVTVTNASGCTNSASRTVTINPLPIATAGSNSPVCIGGTINLNATGGVTYAWLGPNLFNSSLQNPSRTGATLSMTGTYSVTVTDANGCKGTANTPVSVINCSMKTVDLTVSELTAYPNPTNGETNCFIDHFKLVAY